MLSLTGSLLSDPATQGDTSTATVPAAQNSQIAREGVQDVDMGNVTGGEVSERRKRKKEKDKAPRDGAIAVQAATVEQEVKEEDAEGEAAAAKAAKRERKEARRLAKKAAAVAGGLAVDPSTDEKTDEIADLAPAVDTDEAVEVAKKHRKRKADGGGAGDAEGKHKKRKKDLASL
jgi:hypothetical protein